MIRIRENQPLDAMNTLGLPSVAARYGEVAGEAELLELLEHADANRLEPFVLGGGSNIVFTRDLLPPTLVVRLTGKTVTCLPPNSDGAVQVVAEAGTDWHALVSRTLELRLGGLENLALIPGTVGAAPVQNIGAYGVELDERLVGVRAWHRPSHAFRNLATADCAFGYRSSRFKRERGDWIITSATFELGPHRPVVAGYASLAAELRRRGVRTPTPRDIADAVIAIRRARLPDPERIGNAGSFFHNPVVEASEADALAERFPGLVQYDQPDGRVKLAAGWLIDQLGFRGYRENGVGVHEDQALVLVHEGGGDGRALMNLADRVIEAVHERYGIRLNVEPLVL